MLHDRRAESVWTSYRFVVGACSSISTAPKRLASHGPSRKFVGTDPLGDGDRSIKDFEDVGILRSWIRQAPSDAPQAVARRAAIEAIGFHGNEFDVDALIDISLAEQEKDPITAQSSKIACRQLLRRSEVVSGRTIARWEATRPATESVSQMRIALLLSLGDDLAFEPMQSMGRSARPQVEHYQKSFVIAGKGNSTRVDRKVSSGCSTKHSSTILANWGSIGRHGDSATEEVWPIRPSPR